MFLAPAIEPQHRTTIEGAQKHCISQVGEIVVYEGDGGAVLPETLQAHQVSSGLARDG